MSAQRDTWPRKPDGSRMKLGEMPSKERERIFNRILFRIGKDFEAMDAKVTFGGSLKEDLETNPELYCEEGGQ